jgi:homoserine kinase
VSPAVHVRVAVPATAANLGPGFDVLALALELENEVEAERTGEPGITVDPGPGAPPELSDPSHNLVARAYTAACAELGAPADGVCIRCVNRIPFRRGLGSSAAAALGGTLVATALNAAPWDEQSIIEFVAGLEGHPDNAAAALLGGLVVVTPGAPAVRMDVPGDLWAVVFVPELELETALARRVVAGAFTRADAVHNAARCALLVRAVATRDWPTLRWAMEDRWHQPPRSALYPAMPQLIAAALEGGACGAALAGAGPAVIALADREPEAVQESFLRAAAGCGVRGRSLVGRVRNQGAHVDLAPSGRSTSGSVGTPSRPGR